MRRLYTSNPITLAISFVYMKKIIQLLVIVVIIGLAFASCNKRGKPRVLVFSKTMGFRHSSIPAGHTAIMKLGKENGFDVDTTENADRINEDSLKNTRSSFSHYGNVAY